MSLQGRFSASKINAGFTPQEYSPTAVGNEATSKVSAHLNGIDHRLTRLAKVFMQASHGLVVGNAVRYSGSAWVKAQANTEANASALGIITAVSGDNFEVTFGGYTDAFTGLTAGAYYFLSADTAGAIITDLAGIEDHEYKKQIMFSISTSEAIVQVGESRTKAVFFA